MIKSQFENHKFKKRYVLFGTLILLLISIVFYRPSVDKILIASVVWLAYFTGVIAIVFGLVFSIFGYLAALPIISTLYAYIAFILAKIHYIIFRAFVNRTLKRMEWYLKLELAFKNSKIVKKSIKVFHEFLLSLGIDRSRRVKFFEVKKCKNCNKSRPIDGAFCPYCGEKAQS
jgi:Zn-dependent protease with chaperone function